MSFVKTHDANRLGAILMWKASLSHSDLLKALQLQAKRPENSLGDVLAGIGAVSERMLTVARSIQARWRVKGPTDEELHSFVAFALGDARMQATRCRQVLDLVHAELPLIGQVYS